MPMSNHATRIVALGLLLAAAWTAALAWVAQQYGLNSAGGMWVGAIGLPGVVVTNWMLSSLGRGSTQAMSYFLMFLVNWIFYCSVIQGCLSIKRQIWK